MKAIMVLLVFSLMLVTDGHSRQEPPAPSSTTQQTALVRGVITDSLTGAPVPRATIVFENDKGTYSVFSGKDGGYAAWLPVDVYRVGVQRMTYCSGRRPAAHIGSLPETKFDFRLVPCATEHIKILTDGRYPGEIAREVNPFNFDAFRLPPSTSVPGELLLRFGTKQEDEHFIEYEGTKVKHLVWNPNSNKAEDEYTFVGVMLSYNLLTVYADNVKLVKEGFEIEAEGNVIVEDGTKRTKASAVRIKLRGDKPVIDFLR